MLNSTGPFKQRMHAMLHCYQYGFVTGDIIGALQSSAGLLES